MAEKTDLEKFLDNFEDNYNESVEEKKSDDISEYEKDELDDDVASLEDNETEKESLADDEAEDELKSEDADEILSSEEAPEAVKHIQVTISSNDVPISTATEQIFVPDNERKNRLSVITAVIASVTLCVSVIGVILFMNSISEIRTDTDEKQKRIEQLEQENELLKSDYVEAMNVIEEKEEIPQISPYLAEAGLGKLLIYEDTVGYAWVPILSDIKLNTYNRDNFSVSDDGRMKYTDNGTESSYFGIDVSSHQGDIDWQLVRQDGVEFAFLRIGFRGYGEEGNICADESFEKNYNDAHQSGIDLGVYFYSQAVSPEEAVEEAEFLLEILDGRSLEYPVVFDWEMSFTNDGSETRIEDVMPQTLNLAAIAFCQRIEEAGYKPMIYTNKKQAVLKYDLRLLEKYPIWLAYYNTELNYCYDFSVWQYGTGYVEGIEGEVDFDIAIIP